MLLLWRTLTVVLWRSQVRSTHVWRHSSDVYGRYGASLFSHRPCTLGNYYTCKRIRPTLLLDVPYSWLFVSAANFRVSDPPTWFLLKNYNVTMRIIHWMSKALYSPSPLHACTVNEWSWRVQALKSLVLVSRVFVPRMKAWKPMLLVVHSSMTSFFFVKRQLIDHCWVTNHLLKDMVWPVLDECPPTQS